MDKKLLLTGLCTLLLGFGLSNFAMSDIPANYKVATVDVQKIVNSSKAVQKLKTDSQKQLSELSEFVSKAKADLEKETDVNKRKKLEDKYNKQLVEKKAAIEKNYTKKLTEIDKSITEIIQKEATAQGFNLVLTKGVVLYGGTDITSTIEKSIK